MTPDVELLTRYAADQDEAVFADLVHRHLDHVYSTALRLVGGDVHLAEDVAQAVFTDLARKAGSLRGHATLSGWLHTSARFSAANVVRAEQRRRQREQTALTMPSTSTASFEPDWDQVRAFLDETIGELNDSDRDVLMLRFFEKKPLIEVGLALGISEEAARMRVGRAVEKLRTRLAARGITSTAVALSAALAQNLVRTAPVALGSRIMVHALAAAGATAGSLGIWPVLTAKIGIGAGIAVFIGMVGLWRLGVFERASKPGADEMAEMPAGRPNALRPRRMAVFPRTTHAQPRAVRMVFQVISAETGEGITNATVKASFYGPVGSPEGQEATTDETGSANILQPLDRAKTGGPNVFVTADGFVPKVIGLPGDGPASYTMKLDAGRTAAGVLPGSSGRF